MFNPWNFKSNAVQTDQAFEDTLVNCNIIRSGCLNTAENSIHALPNPGWTLFNYLEVGATLPVEADSTWQRM